MIIYDGSQLMQACLHMLEANISTTQTQAFCASFLLAENQPLEYHGDNTIIEAAAPVQGWVQAHLGLNTSCADWSMAVLGILTPSPPNAGHLIQMGAIRLVYAVRSFHSHLLEGPKINLQP